MRIGTLAMVVMILVLTSCGSWGRFAGTMPRATGSSEQRVAWQRAERPGSKEWPVGRVHVPLERSSGPERIGQDEASTNERSEGVALLGSSNAIDPTEAMNPGSVAVPQHHGSDNASTEGSFVANNATEVQPEPAENLDPMCLIAFVFAVLGIVLFLLNNQVSLMLSLIGFLFGIIGLVSAGSGDRTGRGFAIAAMALLFLLVILKGLASENGRR